jgi:hypothetical protein
MQTYGMSWNESNEDRIFKSTQQTL